MLRKNNKSFKNKCKTYSGLKNIMHLASKTAQRIKELAAKTHNLSSIPWTHMVEEINLLLQVVF